MNRLTLLFLALIVSLVACTVPVDDVNVPEEIIEQAVVAQEPPQAPPVLEEPPAIPVEPEIEVPQVLEEPPVITTEPEIAPDEETLEPAFIYPFLGDENAPVTVIEYGDFADAQNSGVAIFQVAAMKRDYVVSNKVKFVFKPFPSKDNANSELAARASLCMWEQGSKQFWAYHNTLFSFYLHLDADSMVNYAGRTPNADQEALRACISSGKYADVVANTLDEGRSLGVEKPSTFFVGENSVFLTQTTKYRELSGLIDSELNKLLNE